MLVMLALLVPANLMVVPDARSPAMLMLPVVLVMLAVMTYGFGLIVAAVNVYFRDVQYILAAILLPWFFLTPIFYTPDALPEGRGAVPVADRACWSGATSWPPT